MTDYAKPVNETDIKKAKTFYDIVCWGGLLIVLLPVGIANIILGYLMGDSPCTLCWGQRQQMAYIGVVALFMVRYGFKPKYLATMLVMAAIGLYSSFRHLGNHAFRDVGQGFGLDIFGLHTQFWAEVVFWCVVMLFGLATFLAPRFDALIAEMRGKPFRPLTGFYKIAFGIVAFIIGSNSFQALWSTGLPPNWGQGDPYRFSWNTKYIKWSDESWEGMWAGINFLGRRDVKDPDFAYAPNEKKLGITFEHDAEKGPLNVNGKLAVTATRDIQGIDAKLNTLQKIRGEYVVTSKYDFWFLGEDLKPVVHAAMDPWFSANVLDIVGVTEFRDDAYVLMGMNKSFLKIRKNPNADDVTGWPNFAAGRDQVEAVDGFGRGRIGTERAKMFYVHSSATDGKYVYMATVPDNKDKKTFVISKALQSDFVLSGEFKPTSDLLKDGRSLGELYVTGMVYEDGRLWAVSKNFNVLIAIDLASEQVVDVKALPADLTDIRGLVKSGDTFEILDGNRIVTLEAAK